MMLFFLFHSLLRLFTAQRWRERTEARRGCTRKEWDELLASQREDKTIKEAAKKREEEEKEIERRRIRSDPSKFFTQDDSMAGSVYRGRDLKVIVKVSASWNY